MENTRPRLDPFGALGLDRAATHTEADVKAAFRAAVRSVHEDAGGTGDTEEMNRIVSARDTLLDDIRRRRDRTSPFDASLQPPSEPRPVRRGSSSLPILDWRTPATLKRGAHVDVAARVSRKTMEIGGKGSAVLSCDCSACLPDRIEAACRVCGGRARLTVAASHGPVVGPCGSCSGTGHIAQGMAQCLYDEGSALVPFDVPPGTHETDRIVVPDGGMPGPGGRGDLLVSMDPDLRPSGRMEFGLPATRRELRLGFSTPAIVPGIGELRLRVPPGACVGSSLHRMVNGIHVVFRLRVDD